MTLAASSLSFLLASCATSGGGHHPTQTPEQVALVQATELRVMQVASGHPDDAAVIRAYWTTVAGVFAAEPPPFDVQVLSSNLDLVTWPYESGLPNPFKDAVVGITADCWHYAEGPAGLVGPSRTDGPALAAVGIRSGLKKSGL